MSFSIRERENATMLHPAALMSKMIHCTVTSYSSFSIDEGQ